MSDVWGWLASVISSVPSEAWGTIGDVMYGALIVSPAALAVKKWLNIEDAKRRERVMTFVVIAGSMLASVLFYLKGVPEFAPWFVLVQGWLTYATTQPVYFLFVKPLAARIGVWFTTKLEAMSVVTEARGAAVPPEGLPVTSTPPPIDDFSQ